MGFAYFHFHYQFGRGLRPVCFCQSGMGRNGLGRGGGDRVDCKKAFKLIMLAINCRFISASNDASCGNFSCEHSSGTLIKCRSGAWPTFRLYIRIRNTYIWLYGNMAISNTNAPQPQSQSGWGWSVCSWNTRTNHFPFRPVIVASVKCVGNDLHKFSNGHVQSTEPKAEQHTKEIADQQRTLYWQNQALDKQNPHTPPLGTVKK